MKINTVWPRKFEFVTAIFITIHLTHSSDAFTQLSEPKWIVYGKNRSGRVGANIRGLVQGTDVEQGEFPFLVGLFTDRKQICAGSLVSKSLTLTACSCLVKDSWDPIIKIPHRLKEPSRLFVQAGTIDFINPSNRGWTERAKALQVHPRCTRNSSTTFIQYDFGFIKVEKPFVQSPFRISVITLPDFRRIDVINLFSGSSMPCVTLGWISDPERQRTWSNNLQKFHVTVQPPDWCVQSIINQSLEEDDPFTFDKRFQMCVIGRDKRKTICEMRNGGPLLCGEGPRKEFIAHITDRDEDPRCGQGIPLVYSRMDRVDEWILGIIQLSNTYVHTSNLHLTIILLAVLTCGS